MRWVPNTVTILDRLLPFLNCDLVHCIQHIDLCLNTVWPEILAGIYFGGLLKFLYLAEFTLAVWQSLCHNDIHSKMANPGEQS